MITDAVDALILIEKSRERRTSSAVPQMVTPFAYLLGGLVVLITIYMFFVRYYLVYNFLWGDYLEYFKKNENIRKFVLVIIIIGILVSFIGGILANMTKAI